MHALLAAILLAFPPQSCSETSGPTTALGLYKPGTVIALHDGFVDPPPISRVQCWWQCHGSAFTKEEITRHLREFKDKGFGGVTVKDTIDKPRDEHTQSIKNIDYMSPLWLEMFAHIVKESGRLKMICRTRLGSGWNAGGPWVTPQLSTQKLRFAISEPLTENTVFEGKIPLPKEDSPTFKTFQSGEAFVVAVHNLDTKGVDLTKRVRPDLTMNWDVPKRSWRLMTCYSAPSYWKVKSSSSSGAGLHYDHLSMAGTDLQMSQVAEKIRDKIGPFESTAFDGFNCDSWELGNPTWTPGLRDTFVKRCGYDPVPFLPVIATIRDEGVGRKIEAGKISQESARFLYDFRMTVSDLAIETHYARIARWCRRHGVAFEAQAGGPTVVPREMLKAQGAVDIPMGEFWIPSWTCVKIPSSAAHAYGHRLVGLESFTDCTPNPFATPPSRMSHRADEAFLLGGNYLNMAVSEYSPQVAGLPGWVHNAGPHITHTQSWWPLARSFLDYLARSCFLLQSGRPVAHVAEYRSFQTAKASLWFEKGENLSKWPKTYTFDWVNDDLIQNHMSVNNGRIELPSGMTYGVLHVAPRPHGTMPLSTAKRIVEMVEQGATVVLAGEPPKQCPGLVGYPESDKILRRIVERLWGDPRTIKQAEFDRFALIPLVEESNVRPIWRLDNQKPFRFFHRRTNDSDIVLVVNRAPRNVDESVVFRTRRPVVEFWDATTGEIRVADSTKTKDGLSVCLRLPALNSVFVVLRDQHTPGALPPRKPMHATSQMPVSGPWELRFPSGWGAPEILKLDKLMSWTKMDHPDVRAFSGVATYRTEFDVPKKNAATERAVLDLGDVKELCEVRLNGKVIGATWRAPYRFELPEKLKPGKNTLEIRVANLWSNRLAADGALPEEKRRSRMAPPELYSRFKKTRPQTSGLLGPVKLLFE
ncbi:MAG: hypothetical protein JXM70_29280 [Pirellulales bacterium]|nr:hypothetical protein [Pirellulales bacterium]